MAGEPLSRRVERFRRRLGQWKSVKFLVIAGLDPILFT
jgi:hypothetical protein